MLKDRFGRAIDGMRISVTNRCNYRCFFCHNEGLRKEVNVELEPSDWGFLAKVGVELGIVDYKITGGEPLLRGDIVEIVDEINRAGGKVSVVTNGSLLWRYVHRLVGKVDHVNVSLFSLNPKLYVEVTGSPLEPVLDGLRTALDYGLKVKLNYVVTSLNLPEYVDIVNFAVKNGFDLNIIELIPLGLSKEDWSKLHVGLEDVARFLEHLSTAKKVKKLHNRTVYVLGNGVEIATITGYDNPAHCLNCTRIRVSPDGRIKTCLYVEQPCLNAYDKIVNRDRDGLIDVLKKAVQLREPFFRNKTAVSRL